MGGVYIAKNLNRTKIFIDDNGNPKKAPQSHKRMAGLATTKEDRERKARAAQNES